MCGLNMLLLVVGSELLWTCSWENLGSVPISPQTMVWPWAVALLSEPWIPHLKWKRSTPGFWELSISPTGHLVDPCKVVVRFCGAMKLAPSGLCWYEWAPCPCGKLSIPGGMQTEAEQIQSCYRSPGYNDPWGFHRPQYSVALRFFPPRSSLFISCPWVGKKAFVWLEQDLKAPGGCGQRAFASTGGCIRAEFSAKQNPEASDKAPSQIPSHRSSLARLPSLGLPRCPGSHDSGPCLSL